MNLIVVHRFTNNMPVIVGFITCFYRFLYIIPLNRVLFHDQIRMSIHLYRYHPKVPSEWYLSCTSVGPRSHKLCDRGPTEVRLKSLFEGYLRSIYVYSVCGCVDIVCKSAPALVGFYDILCTFQAPVTIASITPSFTSLSLRLLGVIHKFSFGEMLPCIADSRIGLVLFFATTWQYSVVHGKAERHHG